MEEFFGDRLFEDMLVIQKRTLRVIERDAEVFLEQILI